MKRVTFQSLLRLLLRLASALTVTLALLSANIQTLSAEGNNPSEFQRPGQLVDIGTHRLHIYCLGSGKPTVIMDAGLGGLSLEWLPIQAALAEHVKTCVYDRAGYGWSDPGPSPRTSSRIADELFVLLNEAQIEGPYVLVGHSFGGYNMQLFASRYQYATAGLVLVDSSHAEQIERFKKPPISMKLAPTIKGKYVITKFSKPEVQPMMPEELKGVAAELMNSIAMRRAMANEFLYFSQSAAEVQIEGELPDIPLFVLTRGMRVWPEDQRGDMAEQLWLELQSDLAFKGPHHIHMLAEYSGHHVHLDQPQLVIDAITEVVMAARPRAVTHVKVVEFRGFRNIASPAFEYAVTYSYTFN